jgi:hypothetical protein
MGGLRDGSAHVRREVITSASQRNFVCIVDQW